MSVCHGRATSGPRRPSVRPATLLGNNIAIWSAKPQPKNAGVMNDIMRHVNVRTETKHFGQCRESRYKLRRPLISSRHWLMRWQCSTAIYDVHWLSRRVMLSRVCDRQKEIATFLRQFFDPRWLARLTLLGKDIIVTGMHAHITAFEVKLRLCDAQLAKGQLEHFTRLAACVPDDVEPDTCVSVVSLRKEGRKEGRKEIFIWQSIHKLVVFTIQ